MIMNKKVSEKIEAKREIWDTIVRRIRIIEHNLKNLGMLVLILEGTV